MPDNNKKLCDVWCMLRADVPRSQAFLEHYCKVDALYRSLGGYSLRMISRFRPTRLVYIRSRHMGSCVFVSSTTEMIDIGSIWSAETQAQRYWDQ
jgi:hypothetical protein